MESQLSLFALLAKRHAIPWPLGRSGAAAAEMALIIPLLSMMIFGVMQYGFMIYTSNSMTTTARNGARLIAFGQNRAAAEAHVRQNLPGWVASEATISTVENDNGVARITVSVPGSSAAIIGLLPMPAQIRVVGSMPRVADR
jgi:Flp pilus assembly protein TadG